MVMNSKGIFILFLDAIIISVGTIILGMSWYFN